MAERGAESSRKNEFPLGMRVLAVDDDRVCLRLLETQLKECGYQGMGSSSPLLFCSSSSSSCCSKMCGWILSKIGV